MGVDLSLLPFYTPRMGDDMSFSHDVLDLERHRELWEPISQIEEEKGFDVPDNFTSYLSRDDKCEDSHYGETVETPYGSRVRYVFAKDLKTLAIHPAVQDNYKNRAVWAYLEQVPNELKVALFWH